ncbi:GTP-binding protein [Kineococcus sp. NUM-3379]
MLAPLPLTVVTSMDAVLRDSATTGVLCDVPGTVVLRYDLGPGRADGLRRTVSDTGGLVERVAVPLEHTCLGCALREDVVPTVAAVAASGRWERVVLALPVSAEPVTALQALAVAEHTGTPLSRLVTVTGHVCVVGTGSLLEDLFGDELLAERGAGLTEDDRRAVGEALAGQLQEADAVVCDSGPGPRARAVLAHLAGPGIPVLGLHSASSAALLARRRDAGEVPGSRSDLLRARPTGALDREGVWTLELSSPRPLHPGRLLERVEDLGAGRLRARGVFWLPGRPDTACAWDGAGGQLSIGDLGTWGSGRPGTRLVVTGVDDDTARLRQAFADVLVRPEELRAPDPAWSVDDGFTPWLGPVLVPEEDLDELDAGACGPGGARA